MDEERGPRGRARRAERRPPTLELVVPGTPLATPEHMLGDPHTVQILGDRTTGIHRRADDLEAEHADRAGGRTEVVTEAYTWENRPGAAFARGLWLTLLPLLLVNLVCWMRPQGPAGRPPARAYAVLSRLLGAALTVQLVASAATVSMDLAVWQCAVTDAACRDRHAWLFVLSPEAWWGRPGPPLVLGALLPVAVLALLARLSRKNWARTEALRPAETYGEDHGSASGEPPLAGAGMWFGRRQVARLRYAHAALGLATVSLLLLAPVLTYDRQDGSAAAHAAGTVLGVLVLVSAAVALVEVARAGRSRVLDQRMDPYPRLQPAVGAGLLLLAAGYALWPRAGWTPAVQPAGGTAMFGTAVGLPGLSPLLALLLCTEVLLVVALAVCCLGARRRHPVPRPVLAGFAGPTVAVLACALALALGSVPATVTEALLLGGPPPSGACPVEGTPSALRAGAGVTQMIAMSCVYFALWSWIALRRQARDLAFSVEAEYRHEHVEPERRKEIVRALAGARLTDAAPVLVGLAGVVSFVFLLYASLLELRGCAPDTAEAPAGLLRWSHWLLTTGTWFGPVLVGLLVTAGWLAYRWPAARRSVGLLWDLGTFWPRGAHPYGPPCLAERAVPDIQWRLTTWTRSFGGRMLLSAHGPGAVLAAAAAFQLAPVVRARLALLTYGSPLARVHGRWFPAYLGPEALRRLEREVLAWRNLYRTTDPIGGPVIQDPASTVDSPLTRDPLSVQRSDQHPLYTPIRGHEEYQADPAFAADRGLLLTRMLPPPPPPRPAAPRESREG
ncbi:hypothetical protein [Streptomyces sp. NPDC086023]|uniref:hypothetical protein n=1 Tax=Streptomyces sp. NPDC086023 TaxID=3365746 RepID=UPI0037D0F011